MSKVTSVYFKFVLSFFATTILSAFLAFGVFSLPAQAQPGKDPNIKYPILTEKDFNLYIKFVSIYADNADAEPLLREYNVTIEYVHSVFEKISLNATAKFDGTLAQLEKSHGKSILLTPAEAVLFEKYEPQVNECLVRIGVFQKKSQ
jgi:hypothetical protein